MLEKQEKTVEKGKAFPSLFTDLSTNLDCVPHGWIVTKSSAYDFNSKCYEVDE